MVMREAGVTTAVIAMLVTAAWPASHASAAFSAAERAQISAGEIIVHVAEDQTGEADAAIEAAMDIAAPPSLVFAVMTDCPRAPTFVAGLISCRVSERSPDGLFDIREHRSQWMALMPQTVSVFRSTYVANKEIRFERAGGDLKFLQGAWTLQPRANGKATRLTYDVRVGASVQLPSVMVRGALQQDVPKLLAALRREVLSGK